jgi:hypothetical protein
MFLFIKTLGGNETFGIRLKNSGSLFGLIWSENANMSNVKGGSPFAIDLNPPRLKHKGFILSLID